MFRGRLGSLRHGLPDLPLAGVGKTGRCGFWMELPPQMSWEKEAGAMGQGSLFQHTEVSLRFLGKWIRGHTVEFLSKHPPSLAKISKWFKPPVPCKNTTDLK